MKLPDIQYGTAARPQTISPGQAAAPHLAKAKMIGQVAEMAGNIYEMKQEHDARESLALYSESMSQFRKDMATRTDPFTQEELEEHGIADQVEVGENGTVEKWRVYAPLLAAKQEEFKQQYGSNIKAAGYRAEWMREIDSANQKEIERAVQDSANMAIQDITYTSIQKADAAIEAGLYDVARAQYALPIWDQTPEMKAKKEAALTDIRDIEYASVQNDELEIEMAYAEGTGDYSNLDKLEAQHRNNENVEGTPWTDKEHTAFADKIASIKTTMENGARTQANRERNDRMDAHWRDNVNDPAKLVTQMPPDATATEVRAIMNWTKVTSKGETVKTNVATWDMLDTMAEDEPDKFMELGLTQYADRLSVSEYQKMKGRQNDLRKIRSGESDGASYMTDTDVINSGLVNMGLSTTGTSHLDKRYAAKTLMATELEAAENERKRQGKEPLSTQDKQDIINGVVMYTIKNEDGDLIEKSAIDKKTDPDVLADASQTLRGFNLPVTGDYIDAYEALEDKDMDVSAISLQAASYLLRNNKGVSQKSMDSLIKTARGKGANI